MPGGKTVVFAVNLAFAAPAFAQADIDLQIGSQKYAASGQGECKSAPRASIYSIPAALYSVSHRAGKDSLNLTLWRPTDGKPDMLSLSVAAGGRNYVVDTVKEKKGSGGAKLQPSARGGTIVLEAVAASGEKISGKIQCRTFGGVQAEGG
jgi:hypothetical protein